MVAVQRGAKLRRQEYKTTLLSRKKMYREKYRVVNAGSFVIVLLYREIRAEQMYT